MSSHRESHASTNTHRSPFPRPHRRHRRHSATPTHSRLPPEPKSASAADSSSPSRVDFATLPNVREYDPSKASYAGAIGPRDVGSIKASMAARAGAYAQAAGWALAFHDAVADLEDAEAGYQSIEDEYSAFQFQSQSRSQSYSRSRKQCRRDVSASSSEKTGYSTSDDEEEAHDRKEAILLSRLRDALDEGTSCLTGLKYGREQFSSSLPSADDVDRLFRHRIPTSSSCSQGSKSSEMAGSGTDSMSARAALEVMYGIIGPAEKIMGGGTRRSASL